MTNNLSQPELQNVSIEVPEPLWRAFKAHAVARGVFVRDQIAEAIEQYLKRNKATQ